MQRGIAPVRRFKVGRLSAHEALRIPSSLFVLALGERPTVDRALLPLLRILGVTRQQLGNRQAVELGEGQPKRAGDPEVSGEVFRSVAEIESFGFGPRPVFTRSTAA